MKRNKESSRVAEPERDARTVRERVLAHMENLMRTATTLGAGIALACGAKAQGPRRPQVCDPPPPPPPACCEDPDQLLLRGCVKQQTRWVKSDGRWSLTFTLWVHPYSVSISFAELKKEEIRVSGASLKDLKIEPRKLVFSVAPMADEKQANMELPVLCNNKKVPLKLVLDLSAPPAENGSVPVKQVR